MAIIGIFLAIISIPWIFCILFSFFLAYKLYHPYRKPKYKESKVGKDFQRIKIPSSPGIELDSILLSVEDSKHMVLITHEIGSFKESKLKIARRLVSKGFSVLLFDLRNHGGSSKDRSFWPMSERFTDDIESALKYARKQFPNVQKFSLYSFSFSTFPALYITTRQLRQPDNIILDSGPSIEIKDLYGKFLDAFGRELGMVPGFLKYPIFYPLLKTCFQIFGLRMLATNWPHDLSKVKSNVLFITNGKDPVFPHEEITRVADRVTSKRVISYANASHLQAYKMEPKNYEQQLIDFLEPQVVVTQ